MDLINQNGYLIFFGTQFINRSERGAFNDLPYDGGIYIITKLEGGYKIKFQKRCYVKLVGISNRELKNKIDSFLVPIKHYELNNDINLTIEFELDVLESDIIF
jgi:hypothetical protein